MTVLRPAPSEKHVCSPALGITIVPLGPGLPGRFMVWRRSVIPPGLSPVWHEPDTTLVCDDCGTAYVVLGEQGGYSAGFVVMREWWAHRRHRLRQAKKTARAEQRAKAVVAASHLPERAAAGSRDPATVQEQP